MKALILCGGQGLRLRGNFNDLPKPLIPIRGRPILDFIIKGYVSAGVRDIALLVGHSEVLFQAFVDNCNEGSVCIKVLQTGLLTATGGRLKRAEDFLGDENTFFVTYGDAMSNVDFYNLQKFHKASGRIATLTAIRPQLPFGLIEIGEAGRVESFVEKPIMEQYANGGFFAFQRQIMDVLRDDADLENDVLPMLGKSGQLGAYRHDGFWKSMDTYKDYLSLEALDLEILTRSACLAR